jgi:hypothetical protein
MAHAGNNRDCIEALFINGALNWQASQGVAVTLDLITTKRTVYDSHVDACLTLRKRQLINDGSIRLIPMN